jgi:hypothetical protein
VHLRQFVLIDHSLQDLGGHHYPLAVSILEAAEHAGYAPVLVAHRRFARPDALPRHWPVHSQFTYRSYSRYALDTQASLHVHLRNNRGLLNLLRSRWCHWQRQRIAQRFATDCRQLFNKVHLAAGDVVFVATASELDLAGLARYLPSSDLPRSVPWHLQFHFGIFRGRDPEYAQQQAAQQAMNLSLQASLQVLRGWSVSLYCTTEPLTRQYLRLGLTPFTTLPYPVHALFRVPPLAHTIDRAARIACLGHSRREKRHGLLPQLLRELWVDFFAMGKAQLVLQSDRAAARRSLTECLSELQSATTATVHLGADGTAVVPVSYAAASLDLESYAKLLRSSDIGLLLYDGERYFDRCSGVLLEMLSSGIPVVVPAASWLSAQIAMVNQRYLAQVATQLAAAQRLVEPGWSWHDGKAQGPWPSDCEGLLIQVPWPVAAPPGVFLQLKLRCMAADGHSLSQHVEVLGDVEPGATAHLLLHTAPGCQLVSLEYCTAFNAPALATAPIQLHAVRGALPALGAVGLTLADPEYASGALRDILNHREHYQRHAADFARECARAHDAAALVSRLTGTPLTQTN